MDKFIGGSNLGAGCQNEAQRQLEVPGALGDQNWRIDAVESAVAELTTRLFPALNNSENKGSDALAPAYSSELAQRIDGHNQRLSFVAAHVRNLLARLEI